jgi:hypothetical protein
MITSSVLADRHTEIEKLRQLSRDMMKKLEPIDELSAGVNEMRTKRLREWSSTTLCAVTYLL